MLDKVPADKLIASLGVGAATVWALFVNIDLAAVAAGIGIICVAVGAGMSSLMSKWSATRIEIQKQEHAAKLDMLRSQAEFDKTNSGTVLGEIQQLRLQVEQANQSLRIQQTLNDALQKSVDVLNGSLEEMKSRVEDANNKLHDLKGQAQRDKLQHAEEMNNLTQRHGMEMGRLTKQLETVNGQLAEANRKLVSLQADSKHGRQMATEAVQTAAKNSQAIQEVTAKVEQLAGSSGATPTVSP